MDPITIAVISAMALPYVIELGKWGYSELSGQAAKERKRKEELANIRSQLLNRVLSDYQAMMGGNAPGQGMSSISALFNAPASAFGVPANVEQYMTPPPGGQEIALGQPGQQQIARAQFAPKIENDLLAGQRVWV